MQEDQEMKKLEKALRNNPNNAATLISKPENQAALARNPAKIMELMALGNEAVHRALKDNVKAIYNQSHTESEETKAWATCLAVITAETNEEALAILKKQQKSSKEFQRAVLETAILASPARREMFEGVKSIAENLADTIAQAKENEQEKVGRLQAELSIINTEEEAIALIENNKLLFERHPEVLAHFKERIESEHENEDIMVVNAFQQFELFDVVAKIDASENVDAVVEILAEHAELYEDEFYQKMIDEAIAAKGDDYAEHFGIPTTAEINAAEEEAKDLKREARDAQLEEWGLYLAQQLSDVFKKHSGPNAEEGYNRLNQYYEVMSGSLYDILNNENEGPTLLMNALQVDSKPMLQQLKAMDFFKDKKGGDWELVKIVFEEKIQQAEKESPRKFVRGVVQGLRSAENTPIMGRRAESRANSTRSSRAASVETETVTIDPSESRLNLLFAKSESPGRTIVFSVLGLNVLKKVPLDDVVAYAIKNPQRAEVLLKHFASQLGKRPDLLINLYEGAAKNDALMPAIQNADLLNSSRLDGLALRKALNPLKNDKGHENWFNELYERTNEDAEKAALKKIGSIPRLKKRLEKVEKDLRSARDQNNEDLMNIWREAKADLTKQIKSLEEAKETKIVKSGRKPTHSNFDKAAEIEQYSNELKNKKNEESVSEEAQRNIVEALGKIQHKGLREAIIQNFKTCMENSLSNHLPAQVEVETLVSELNKQMSPTKGGLSHKNFVEIREVTLRESGKNSVPVTTLLSAPESLFPSKELSRGLIKELPQGKQRDRSPEISPKQSNDGAGFRK